MIITGILNLLYGIIFLITSPIRLFSDVVLPSGITSGLGFASGYLSALNAILPIDTILEIFAVFLGFELAYFTWKAIMWVIRKIPTIN